ncbi:hypothetical protein BH11PAT2_BH11PAT2_04250 [soil metagenome]
MTHHGAAHAVTINAARRAEVVHKDLLGSISSAAERLEVRNCEERKRVRRSVVTSQRELRVRTQAALRGLNALCDIGATDAMQSLLKVRGSPIVIWGGTDVSSPGGDMGDTYWEYVAVIALTSVGVRIEWCTKSNGIIDQYEGPFLFISRYSVEDDHLRSRPLCKIATIIPMDLENCSRNDRYSPEALFEVLVACSDPGLLEEYIQNAIG